MGKKKGKDNIKISLIGNNASGVTGSSILLEFSNGKKMLLEIGMFQDGTALECYRENSKLLNQINSKEIDYVVINHSHIDHCGLVPALVSRGFKGRIITTHITAQLMKPLLTDSAFIMSRELEKGQINCPKTELLYNTKDVDELFNYVTEYDYGVTYNLDDSISFKLLKNNHILGASSIEIWYKNEASRVFKIFYSSDMGNPMLQKPFVEEIEYCKTANIAFFESTYGNTKRSFTKKERKEELEKFKSLINEVVIEGRKSILIPCFSLDRTQHILKILYDIYSKDNKFDEEIKVVVDSKLSSNITNVYKQVLKEDNLNIINNITEWERVKIITDYNDTRACIMDKSPKIIISASGMADKGHVTSYIENFISKSDHAILFVGYGNPRTLSGKLREEERKYIKINNKNYKINCKVETLSTFSSHMQKEQLLNYMKMINADKIVLVHGDKESKEELCKSGIEELRKINKTTQIINSQKGMVIKL